MHRQGSAPRRAGWGFVFIALAAGCNSGSSSSLTTPRIGRPSAEAIGTLTVGAPFALQLAAAGGGAMQWSVVVGELPDGLALGADTGLVSGTPAIAGIWDFTIEARNPIGTGRLELGLEVTASVEAPRILTMSLPGATVGEPWSFELTAEGDTPMTWTVGSGALPDGLALGASTGVLAGTPTSPGETTFTVLATNAGGADSQELMLTITEAPIAPSIDAPGPIESGASVLPSATAGSPWQLDLTATGTAPISWTVPSGTLPATVTIDAATGRLAGEPPSDGVFEFTVRATNIAGSDDLACRLTVSPVLTLSGIAPSSAPTGATVVLSGSGFDASDPGAHTVTFGVSEARVLAATATTLSVEVPAGLVSEVDVTAARLGATSDPVTFTASSAQVVFVDASATGEADGSSWTDAHTSLALAIQQAILAHAEIWVAAGTYVPGSQRSDAFVLSGGVEILGGFAGDEGARDARDPVQHVTVLSGDLLGDDSGFSNHSDNSERVVVVQGSATLDGLTIRGGNADAASTPIGGGIWLQAGALTLRRCELRDNTAFDGGAIAAEGGSLAAEDCRFLSNRAIDDGGAMQSSSGCTWTFDRCVLADNQCADLGGAIRASGQEGTLRDCVLTGNSANQGGATFSLDALTIVGCTFVANSALQRGGAVYSDFRIDLTNSILRGNSAPSGAQIAMFEVMLSGGVAHCNLEGGIGGIWVLLGGGSLDGGGNIDADPRFANVANLRGDDGRWATSDDGLALEPDSPSVDSADANAASAADIVGVARPQGIGVDMGAYETPGGGV